MAVASFNALSRRTSLLTLGAAGLAAAIAGATGEAKNKNKNTNKKIKKKAKKKCKKQVGQCSTTFTEFCEESTDNPADLEACLEDLLSCCQFLSKCDLIGAFMDCLS